MESLAPDVPEGVLLQLAPKGSFRLPQLLEFLTWDLGAADPTGDDRPGATAEVILLDWFAPHLHESVDDCCKPAYFEKGERTHFPAPTKRNKPPRYKGAPLALTAATGVAAASSAAIV